ncbi:hypothetical protein GE061_010700 [Apolygus lucorum]|uniref:Uncharacterized protein n=1 Tax=Apolygus lucorum TaxID=248454 RepID=A0A6A4KA65_APOLU|nr:hypothetical protein GE061_010700 [Apolygus lucorum]
MKEIVLFQLILLGIAGASVINRGVVGTDITASFNVSSIDVLKGVLSMQEHKKTFDIIKTLYTWNDAVVYCKERHGNLASIRSEEEHDQIVKMMNYTGLSSIMYIGGTSARSGRGYYWISDGESLTYQNWSPGQPSGNQECIVYEKLTSGWKWNNLFCNTVRPFACEYYPVSNFLE